MDAELYKIWDKVRDLEQNLVSNEEKVVELTEKICEGWLNSFQVTEIGKLTSRISDLQGRISELEKLKPLTVSDTPITYQETFGSPWLDLVKIKEASESLLAYLKEQDALSLSLLNALWEALGNEDTDFYYTHNIRIDK